MIFVLLLVPIVVGIGLQIVGQGVRSGSGQVEGRTVLLLDLNLARRTVDFDVTLEHGHGGVGVFQFEAEVGRLGERAAFPVRKQE